MADNRHTTLGELFKNRREPGQADMPLMSVTMNDGLVDRESLDRKTDSELTSEGHLLVRAGDIAYNMMRMWQGASGIAEHDAIVSPAYVVLAPTTDIDPLFASYWFKSSRMIYLFWAYSYGITGDRLRLYYKDFASIPVTLPPKPRQTLIGKALSAWDRQIEWLGKLIVEKTRLRDAVANQLLFGRHRLCGFGKPNGKYKVTEVGEIPSEWDVAKLGSCLSEEPTYGVNASAVPFQEHLPKYLRITDISDDGRLTPEKRVSVEHANSESYFLHEGDVVFARTGATVGKSYLYRPSDGPLVFAGFLIRVRPNSSLLNSAFLAAYTNTESYWNWVRQMSARSGQPGVNGKEYRRLPIPLPPVDEQNAIVAVLDTANREIELLNHKRSLLVKQQKGLMQQLFDKGMKVKV